MKLQWRSLSALQESRFAAFKQRKDLIGNLNYQQHVKSFKLKRSFRQNTCRKGCQSNRPYHFLLCRRE